MSRSDAGMPGGGAWTAADEVARSPAALPECGVQTESALLKFFKWAMREGPWDGCDLDGGSIQDKAKDLGLIVMTKYDPEKHDPNPLFAEGDDYFEFSPALSLPVTERREEKALALLRWGTWDMTPAARLDWKNRVEEFLSSSVPSADRGRK